MIRFIVDKFSDKIQKENLLSEKDLKIMRYGMTTVLSETFKTIFFILFFSVLGFFSEVILCILILLTLRTLTGGIHLSSFWKCFFFSFSMLILPIIILPKLIELNKEIRDIILLVSVVMVTLFSPVLSIKKPNRSLLKIRIYKALSIISICIWSYSLNYIKIFFDVKNIGIWFILILASQLPIGRRIYKNELIKKKI